MRIPRALKALSILPMAAVFAGAQPVITPSGVVNAAGNVPGALPNSGIALGSVFLINGSGLGADNPAPMSLLQNSPFPLPSSQGLNGTTVQVQTNISSGYAILLYESATQVAAIMPSNTPYGSATVTVTYNGQTSAPAPVMVVQRKFDVFSLNGTGSGPGYIYTYNSNTDTPLNRVSRPAKPGQTVFLIGTGLGAVRGDETRATFSGNMPGLVLDLQIFVGGKKALIDQNQDYMGRLSCCAGIDQVFFQVPAGVTGCYVPVTVLTDGLASNTTTMAISSDGGLCSEPNVGLSGADLQTMVSNNSARVGIIGLTRAQITITGPNGQQQLQNDAGTASFVNMTPTQFVSTQGSLPSPGGCIVSPANAAMGPAPTVGTPMDAGPALNINGPTGSIQLTQSSDGASYAASLGASYLEAGSYEADDGGGGNDVGAFQATLDTPPPFLWSPQPNGASVPKNLPLEITWRGGDPNSVVLILGLSQDSAKQVGAIFACTERNSVGIFYVPAYILSWMPTNSIANSFVSVFDVVQGRFSAPGLDAGYFQYEFGQTVNVQFAAQAAAKF